ncbi:MAG TPA: RNA polymerase sigma factor [Bacteroidales bacterium]|nr:RNA polymerase sigma factor [Bacteroidales bacterium]
MRQQEREAFFESMVKAYGTKLYNLIRSIVLNHDDADDLMQETLLKAWKSLESFRNEASYATWLYRIALNEALRHQQRAALRRRFLLAKPAQSNTAPSADQTESILSAALQTLTARQRSVFAMHYFNSLSFAEIGQLLHVTEATAKATYHQSAIKIKQYIHQHAEN